MARFQYTNRLINEKSPYLLQHAHNPVNWYPWGEEAFDKARIENKPIFLSIGYSSCHWCHVMEQESFNNVEVSEVLNEHFIAIKVDKEERPDIDRVYMEFCQAINGNGGWPLTIIMTHEQKPFYAATYLPKLTQGRYIGLIDILLYMNHQRNTNKQELIDSSNTITKTIKAHLEKNNDKSKINRNIIDKAFNDLFNQFDHINGGFGESPKFPTMQKLLFLLRYYLYSNNIKALNMVEKTLQQMYKGGIFDHIGYGFSRYSVDSKWLIPHFEKMMYDNALIGITYLEAYLVTKKQIYKDILENILSFSKREMLDKDGGFYTAVDADSEHEEGKYYLWDYDELANILTNEEFGFIINYYDISKKGNFEGKNVLNLLHHDKLKSECKKIKIIKEKLLKHRKKRTPPLTDTKILTSINGMMIALFSLAGRYLNDVSYIDIAMKATNFILNNLIDDKGQLLSRYKDNEAKYRAYLNDYAYFVYGLIELFNSTSDERFLNISISLTNDMIKNYYDKSNGGFFLTHKDNNDLIIRAKELYDGAIPSGNSVATMNLLRLGLITDNYQYDKIVSNQLSFLATKINKAPSYYIYTLISHFIKNHTQDKIVLIYKYENEQLSTIKQLLYNKLRPFSEIMILNNEKIKDSDILSIYYDSNNDLVLHFCENNTCIEPLTEYQDIIDFLNSY